MSDAMRDALKAVSSWSHRIPGSDDYRMPKSAMVAVDVALATAPADATKLAREAQFLLDRLDEFFPDDVREYAEHIVPAAERLRAALSTAPGESGDWPEDAAHENGNYTCQCVTCLRTFTGHKRRVVCKLCAATAPGESEGARDAIPEGVYYHDGNFYDCRTRAGMGFTFWNRWRHRAESFPPAPPAAPAGEAGMREALENLESILRARLICDTETPRQRHALLDDALVWIARALAQETSNG